VSGGASFRSLSWRAHACGRSSCANSSCCGSAATQFWAPSLLPAVLGACIAQAGVCALIATVLACLLLLVQSPPPRRSAARLAAFPQLSHPLPMACCPRTFYAIAILPTAPFPPAGILLPACLPDCLLASPARLPAWFFHMHSKQCTREVVPQPPAACCLYHRAAQSPITHCVEPTPSWPPFPRSTCPLQLVHASCCVFRASMSQGGASAAHPLIHPPTRSSVSESTMHVRQRHSRNELCRWGCAKTRAAEAASSHKTIEVSVFEWRGPKREACTLCQKQAE
jgi:hypothetical protein